MAAAREAPRPRHPTRAAPPSRDTATRRGRGGRKTSFTPKPTSGQKSYRSSSRTGHHHRFLGHAGGLWHEAARHVADRLRVPLRAVGLDGQLTDPEDRLVEAYGIGDGGASLVRPDGVVAWRSAVEVPDPTATLHRVICQLLDRAE
ncbi:aromatic-ring hydroxylase C-terminal domain-containing protein [Streptomyces griseoaurantiacus]|uniref:aromatic-ring hydroxylase C-terminal domain-containing protein n=1 Tax=Streptomyces griseoaurantiacus TaxID=68213 RepID=UPI00384AE3E5